MLPEAIELIVVTPERQLLHETVVEVIIPGLDGELGILPGHAPLITELGIGELRYQDGYFQPARFAGDTPRVCGSLAGPRHGPGGNRRARRRNRSCSRGSGKGARRKASGFQRHQYRLGSRDHRTAARCDPHPDRPQVPRRSG